MVEGGSEHSFHSLMVLEAHQSQKEKQAALGKVVDELLLY